MKNEKEQDKIQKSHGNKFVEISLPIMKVWKTGNSHVLTIPTGIIKKYDISEGQDIFAVLFIRKYHFKYEHKKGKMWVQLDKEKYQHFKELDNARLLI